ncbi:MAG: hypothetical protein JW987_11205 [Anaerolineaceae bacterium]|nr:hypothetical protein [Anaerolineaceae bacterium]
MNTFSNSWKLFKASLKVLAADKELLIFPIISSIGLMIVTATFALPMFLSGFFDSMVAGGFQITGVVVLFLFYVVQYTVIFFANTALVGAAMIRLRGGDPTIGDGLRVASKHFGPILGYALIAATVGVILKSLNRKNGLGRMIVSLIGLAWNVATYLVVPVLALEDVGPIEAIKRSVTYLKRTWGEQIVGGLGLGWIFAAIYILALVIFVPVVLLIVSGAEPNLWLLGGVVVLFLLTFSIIGLIKATLEGIYSAAVYQYAVEGQVSGYFDESLVRGAMRS